MTSYRCCIYFLSFFFSLVRNECSIAWNRRTEYSYSACSWRSIPRTFVYLREPIEVYGSDFLLHCFSGVLLCVLFCLFSLSLSLHLSFSFISILLKHFVFTHIRDRKQPCIVQKTNIISWWYQMHSTQSFTLCNVPPKSLSYCARVWIFWRKDVLLARWLISACLAYGMHGARYPCTT